MASVIAKYTRILIVDDSSTSRMIIKKCFQLAGLPDADYFEAEDGLRAEKFLEEQEVDLILTDLKMPKMDGKTFIRKIKARDDTRKIPVIVISCMGDNVLKSSLLEKGVESIIMKPISPAKVSATLKALG